MKFSKSVVLATTLAVIAALSVSAMADDDTFCEVKKHGEKAKKATGYCGYSIEGDKITIDLANDEYFTLTRKNDKEHQYTDQDGKNVQREDKKNGTHYYKWEHKNITVYPDGR